MGQIIDGKMVSIKYKESIKNDVECFVKKYFRAPKLSVILVGDDSASQVYVRNKSVACDSVGIASDIIKKSSSTTEEELLNIIYELSKNDSVDGILVQLPLPDHINERKVIEAIPDEKDVDCFSYHNTGKLFHGCADIMPCTPYGIIELLNYYNLSVSNKNCVVIGRSNIVGKPLAMLLLQNDATVTICHSKTNNIAEYTKKADFIFIAIGRSKFLTSDMIKNGAIVVDIGINRDQNNKLCGDCDFDSCIKKASFITPVPGGVGPMTISMLLRNTVVAATIRSKKNYNINC